MEDNLIHKFMSKAKNKFSKKKNSYPSVMEYAFSTEEIDDLNQKNKKKILELKQDLFSTAEYKKKKDIMLVEENEKEIKPVIEEKLSVPNLEATLTEHSIDHLVTSNSMVELEREKKEMEESSNIEEETTLEEQDKNTEAIVEPSNSQSEPSFIHLNKDYQKIVMERWNHIDIPTIDKDILYGKDLLNHNYTITYPDDAARFIHKIRKEYEVVICYLIGFNNEKKGIINKTIFSNKIDDEWHYLSNYIKILEKIRSSKK